MTDATDRQGPSSRRWHWLLVPVIAALLSRVLSILLVSHAAATGTILALSPRALAAWDGGWYMRIAHLGYHAEEIDPRHHDFAFPPGWPELIRAISLDGRLPLDVVAVVLANVLFVLATVVVYRIFVDRFSREVALAGTLLMCFNPASYVFSMAYSESLFLLLAALFFLRPSGRAAPLFAAGATLVRISGLAIGASAAVSLLLHRAPRRRLIVTCAAVALAFAAWWIYIWQLTGSFTGWFQGSAAWPEHLGIDSIAFAIDQHPWRVVAWVAFVALMVVGSVLLVRTHPDLATYALFAIVPAVLTATIWSAPRYSIVAFPAFAGLASRLGPRLSMVLLGLFVAAEFVFVIFAFGSTARNPP